MKRIRQKRRSQTRKRERRPASRVGPRQGHEQQAQEAARRVLGGEQHVARRLSPVPAAAYHVPASRPEPLPGPLQIDLETGFGADLSAVRIHRDAAAAAAAGRERANAFAAGRHIFFNAGAYAPHSESGRELIAHEVAHVLQQTGRATAGGRVRAAEVESAGEIQRDWESPLSSSWPPPELVAIFAAHDDFWVDAESRAEIARLQASAAGALDREAFWRERASFTTGTAIDPVFGVTHLELHPGGRACLYDALKLEGEKEGAARLLRRHADIKTLFFDEELYEHYVDTYGLDHIRNRIYAIWNRAPFFGWARPRSLILRTLSYLTGPTRGLSRQEIASGVNLTAQIEGELRRRNPEFGSGPLPQPVENELYFVAVKVAGQLEETRFKLLLVARRLAGTISGGWQLKQAVAANLYRMASAMEADDSILQGFYSGEEPAQLDVAAETDHLVKLELLPAMANLAAFAVTFWSGMAVTGEEAFAAAEVQAAVQTIDEDPNFSELAPAIIALGSAVFTREADGSLPNPGTYNQQIGRAKSTFKTFLYESIEKPFVDAFRPALEEEAEGRLAFLQQPFEVVDRERILRTGWALNTGSDLIRHIDQYDLQADRTLAAQLRTAGQQAAQQQAARTGSQPQPVARDATADYRVEHRIRFARILLNVAAVPGWGSVAAVAGPVATAQEIIAGQAQTENVLAFLHDWQEDEHAPVQRLAADHGRGAVRYWEPLQVSEIVDFYAAETYYQQISQIDMLLQVEAGQYEAGQTPLLNRAMDAARAEERPRRYHISNWIVACPGTPGGGCARQTLQAMIVAHPFTQALAARLAHRFHYPPGGTPAIIVPAQQDPDAVVWFLPMPTALIRHLQGVPGLNEIIAERLGEAIAGGELSPKLQRMLAARQLALAGMDEDQILERLSEEQDLPALQPITAEQLGQPTFDSELWWNLLRLVIAPGGVLDEARKAEVRRLIEASGMAATLREQRQVAFEELISTVRFAISHERRRLVEVRLKPMLERFDAHSSSLFAVPETGRQVGVRLLAEEVLVELHSLLFQISEEEERDGHLALALIEMSELIHSKLSAVDEPRVLYAWLPALERALDRIENTQAQSLEAFLVEEEMRNQELISQGKQRLEEVYDAMVTNLEAQQEEWGLVGVTGDATIENPGHVHAQGSSREIGRDTVFVIDGRSWQIMQVMKNFTYHPAAWERRGQQRASRAGGSLLSIEGGELKPEGERGNEELLRVMINDGPDVTVVNEQDNELLNQLTWATIRHTQIQQLLDMADLMMLSMEITMDVVATAFGGAGIAVAAARLIQEITSFTQGPLRDIVKELINNPEQFIRSKLGEIAAVMNPVSLIQYFLLESHPRLERMANSPRSGQSRMVGGTTSRRFRRLLVRMQTILRNIGRSVGRVLNRVRDARQAVQLLVLRRPLLTTIISLIADNFWWLADLAQRAASFLNFRERAAEFGERIQEMLDSFTELELPREILPLDALVNVIIDLVGHRLGGKYKLGIRLLMGLLEAAGLREKAVGLITSGLRRLGVTTDNLFPQWEDDVVPELEQGVTEAQEKFYGRLQQLFTAVHQVVPEFEVTIPEPGVHVTMTDEDVFGEMQPLLIGRTIGVPSAVNALTGGAPLPGDVRTEAERRFGHDFSHVRLHSGAPAWQLTRQIRAHALTSGSRILLAQGLDIASPTGRRILYHELAHVLQQTGARPLGGDYDTEAQTGEAGRGITLDPAAERAATTAADAALTDSPGRPVPLGSIRAGSPQPALIDQLTHRFLRYLTAYEEIEEEAAAIDATGSGAGGQLIGTDVRNTVSNVAGHLDRLFNRRPAGQFRVDRRVRPIFSPVREETGRHLHNRRQEITNAINDLAIQSSRVVRRGTESQPPLMGLRVDRFKDKLTRYIFGRSGVLLNINLKTRFRGRHKQLIANDPVDWVEVQYIHLPPISGNSALWQQALTHRPGPAPGVRVGIPQDQRARLRIRVREVLRVVGPVSDAWDDNNYMLSDTVFDLAEDLERAAQATPTVQVPEWSRYVNPAPSANPNVTGLRVGTHGQLRGLASAVTNDRESHHIPQYLLINYFSNRSRPSLFGPGGRRRLPGFDHPREPTRFSGNELSINFGAVDVGARADGMPAVLLARDTHRRGRLHLDREPSWDTENQESPAFSTQGQTIDNLFQARLRTELGLGNTAADTDVLDRLENAENPHRPTYNAMRSVYGHMYYRVMRPALELALENREVPYYAAVAARQPEAIQSNGDLKPEYTPKTSDLTDVIRAVDTANTRHMVDWR